jgi:aldehyde dehydrogenase (NAD+)
LICVHSFVEVIEAANSSSYGLGCSVFSENIKRALRVTHELEAGSAWASPIQAQYIALCLLNEFQVNLAAAPDIAIPFGGYKQSGIGREFGEYALATFVSAFYPALKVTHRSLRYTQVKGVHVNLGMNL